MGMSIEEGKAELKARHPSKAERKAANREKYRREREKEQENRRRVNAFMKDVDALALVNGKLPHELNPDEVKQELLTVAFAALHSEEVTWKDKATWAANIAKWTGIEKQEVKIELSSVQQNFEACMDKLANMPDNWEVNRQKHNEPFLPLEEQRLLQERRDPASSVDWEFARRPEAEVVEVQAEVEKNDPQA